MKRKAWQHSQLDGSVIDRFKKVGKLGEYIAEILLKDANFNNVENLNKDRKNTPDFDLYAEKGRFKYAISVKTRNKYENPAHGIKLNSRYKLTDNPKKFEEEAYKRFKAIPSFVAIAMNIDSGNFDAYFGRLQDIKKGNKKGILMSEKNLENYQCLTSNKAITDMGITKEEYVKLKNEYKKRIKKSLQVNDIT